MVFDYIAVHANSNFIYCSFFIMSLIYTNGRSFVRSLHQNFAQETGMLNEMIHLILSYADYYSE